MKGMWTRRRFLIAAAGLLAGCSPANRSDAPTAYVPGSGTVQPPASTPPAIPRTEAVNSVATAQPMPASVPVTEVVRLYQHTYRLVPDVKLTDWNLRIDGLVDNPLTFTLDAIRAMPAVKEMRTLECIGNPIGGGLVGNIIWTGIAFEQVLARIGVKTSATHASFEASDGYTTTVELKWITQPGVLLVYDANGQPLPREHGYPLRILMPGLYGQKMPKWVTRITFTDHDSLGYWEGPSYNWSNIAAVKTNSKIAAPLQAVEFGSPVRVEGMAFAGARKITKVEISTEGVDRNAVWTPATLIAPPSPLAWTWWVYDWSPPAPGYYRLAVRATDERNFRQSEPPKGIMSGVFPDGTDAIHVLSVTVNEKEK